MTNEFSKLSRSLVDVAMGRNPADIVVAANRLARAGCGQIVVRNGEVIDLVELPIAGLMSNESADLVAQKAATVLDGFSTCGCKLNNPNMQLSLMSLVAIPELRISDKRLVDITTLISLHLTLSLYWSPELLTAYLHLETINQND